MDNGASKGMDRLRRNDGRALNTAARTLLLAVMALEACSAVRPAGLGDRCGANFLCGDGLRCNGRKPPVCALQRGRCITDGDCEGGSVCQRRSGSEVGTCDRKL